jgi:hypothetical protein
MFLPSGRRFSQFLTIASLTDTFDIFSKSYFLILQLQYERTTRLKTKRMTELKV